MDKGIEKIAFLIGRVARGAFLAVFLGGVLTPAWALELTFPEGLAKMKAGSEVLQAAAQREENRREALAATRASIGPRSAPAPRYTQIDDPITLDLNPIRRTMAGLHNSRFRAARHDHGGPGPPFLAVGAGGDLAPLYRRPDQGCPPSGPRPAWRRPAAQGERSMQRLTSDLVSRYFG
jgi:hypothetical protein